jgi:hypothetical protein
MAQEWRRWLRATTAAISIGATVRPLTAAAAQPPRTFHGAPHLLGPDERIIWAPNPLDGQYPAPLVLSLPPPERAPAFLDDSEGLSPLAIAGIVAGGVALAVGIYFLVLIISASHASGRPYRAAGTEERRHAELAWGLARWCWSSGARARDAVMDAPAPACPDFREAPDEDSLASAGRPSRRVVRGAWARITEVALARRARLARVGVA